MKSAAVATLKEIISSRSAALWGRRLILGVSGGLLVWAPLAYGAVIPRVYFPLGLAVTGLSLGLLTAGLYEAGARPGAARFLPYPPLWWLAVGLGLLVLVQVLPWPQGVAAWLSPGGWKVRALGEGLGLAAYLPLSLNPYLTLQQCMKLWPALVLFLILIYSVRSRQQLLGLVTLILVVALFEVVYGARHYRDSHIWGWLNSFSRGRLNGTFINSNHLATLLDMAILLGYGWFLAQRRPALPAARDSTFIGRVRRWSRAEYLEPQFRQYLLLFLLVVLIVGLVFTGSRGGMISLVAGFALMALLVRGQGWARGHLLVMPVFLAAALIYSLLLGGSEPLARFHDWDHQGRYHTMAGALAMFRENPWLGVGLGTFGDLYYRYGPMEFHVLRFDHAFNDWLQMLAEGGVVGFLLVTAAWVIFFSALVKQWRRRRDAFARYLGLGGMAALGAGVFHSLGEFPFHIPALSLTFAAIAAITYLAVHWHASGGGYFSYPTLKFSGHRQTAAAVLVGLVGLQLTFGLSVYRCWLAEKAAPTEVDLTRPAAASGVEDFNQALALNPWNSKYYAGLAEALEKSRGNGKAPLNEAEAALKEAIFRAPGYFWYHLKLAEFYLRQQAMAPETLVPQALEEFSAAVALYPGSGVLHLRLAMVLNWAESLDSALVPAGLRDAGTWHREQALRLDPGLKKLVP